jgi:hypothetical protein
LWEEAQAEEDRDAQEKEASAEEPAQEADLAEVTDGPVFGRCNV